MITLTLAAALAVLPGDTVRPADIARAYEDVVDVVKQGPAPSSPITVRVRSIDALPADHLLRGFLEENGALFAYLVLNATGFEQRELLGGPEPIEEQRARFRAALIGDSTFRSATDPLVASYLASRGHVVLGIVPEVRSVTIDDIQTIAVRFFYPDTMAPGGQFGGHICVGKNGLADHPNRDPLVEALAYGALMGQLRRDPSALSAAFRRALLDAQTLNLSADSETALARAQGVVWHELRDDALLRSILTDFIRARDTWLPLQLI